MSTDTKPETWEERIARERVEAKAAQKAARLKIRAVFKALGWREVKTDDGSAMDDRAWLEAVNDTPEWSGLTLHASAGGWRQAGKVKWAVEYPGPKAGARPYDRDWPKPDAMMSLDKNADVMAREVERRIFPDALKGLEMARKANAESDNYQSKRDATLQAVLGRDIEEDERRSGKSNLRGLELPSLSYGYAQADGHAEVSLELHGVPESVAVRIIALLREPRK